MPTILADDATTSDQPHPMLRALGAVAKAVVVLTALTGLGYVVIVLAVLGAAYLVR